MLFLPLLEVEGRRRSDEKKQNSSMRLWVTVNPRGTYSPDLCLHESTSLILEPEERPRQMFRAELTIWSNHSEIISEKEAVWPQGEDSPSPSVMASAEGALLERAPGAWPHPLQGRGGD